MLCSWSCSIIWVFLYCWPSILKLYYALCCWSQQCCSSRCCSSIRAIRIAFMASGVVILHVFHELGKAPWWLLTCYDTNNPVLKTGVHHPTWNFYTRGNRSRVARERCSGKKKTRERIWFLSFVDGFWLMTKFYIVALTMDRYPDQLTNYFLNPQLCPYLANCC